MNTDAFVLLGALGLSMAVIIGALIFLQWRSARASTIFQQQLLELSRRVAEAGSKQDGVAAVLAEGQSRNLRVLQDQFAAVVDTLNRQLGNVTSSLNDQLSHTRGNIGRQLDSTRNVVQQVQERLGEINEAVRHMHELGKDMASLQDILRAPKLRGGLGEILLEDLLSQVLPAENFQTQYAFSSGERVDAVIRLGDSLVPVDSKFPLESFTRLNAADTDGERRRARREFASSVRGRVDEIAAKYIHPDEGTFDFALMYIPAENIFYEVIIKEEGSSTEEGIFSYALARHVIPVSPNSFYAYLMAVAYGLKGLRIEREAHIIRGQIGEISGAVSRFADDFQVLGRHLDNARSRFNDADRKLLGLRETFRIMSNRDGPAKGA